ncbi:GMC oxidoreductase [Pseudonocardia nigra]|uniref:GMC oxidoreductase n=1 Tax=Pseudonocardia nigra TaxID=1921578 RepID=UPI001C5FAE71|nr:GMC family oxidoreductase [Pseudonocardia nigra]
MTTSRHDYDVLVIGSGFGGSVSALRLTEKGYRVGVLEAGRRFADAGFPKTSWDVRKFLWAPKLGCTGIQRIHLLPDVVVLAGAGVGGGSLVYANTLYRPKSDAFYNDPQWAYITDWRTELAPFYDQAARMLGVVPNPTMTPSDREMRRLAQQMGVGGSFGMAPVGVFFGRDGHKEPGVEIDDPYFGGVGPRRRGCLEVGECMTGCRHNAKNTLVKNYLHLAELAGATVHPLTTVARVRPLASGGYAVDTVRTGAWRARRTARTFTAEQVVLAAGTWGTQDLLHRMKADGTLPALSDRLGTLTRTNSEALCGAGVKLRHRRHHDFTQGVAITSSIHPNADTHIEPVRYGKGSNLMGLLGTVMTDGRSRFVPRWLRWLGQVVRHPGQLVSLYAGLGHWSERSIIALVMQTLDNSLTLHLVRGRFGRVRLSSEQGHGQPNPTWIPAANDAMRRLARNIDGMPFGSIGEVVDIPMTAHFLGGAAIGDSAETGVVDPYHRVYGHPGLHIVDGSTISANLGVNPSLTITAQAERAMALWPNKGDADTRPAPGSRYRQLAPVPPRRPVVPETAPAALRLPVVDIR